MVSEISTNTAQPALTRMPKQFDGIDGIIAHNLRGCGQNIKMLTEILLKKNIHDDSAHDNDTDGFTAREALQCLDESSTALLETLNTLMDLAKIELNKNIQRQNCDIANVAGRVKKQLCATIRQKKATITLSAGLPHISYPGPYMENILYNLISNALKYSRPGIPPVINIATYLSRGACVLSVKDNGLGIDMERYGKKVFNLYQIFHSGFDSKGVGLHLLKKQIESLGGTIAVKSTVNEGSEFIVTF